MKKTILGLDLGTNSIGWSLIKQNFEEKQGEILGMGSRIVPMGAELSKFEQGQAQTKNANRRIARGGRKLNKRYKQRRNKLIYVLQELGMLPNQIQLVENFSDPNKIDKISIKPISKSQKQLTAFDLLDLRVKALSEAIDLKDFGKIIYKYNQLRGYAGGNAEPDKDDIDTEEPEESEKRNESFIVFSKVLSLSEPEEILFKGKKLNKRKISIETEEEIFEGETFLESIKVNDSLELQVNIRKSKKGDTITIKLPNKTSWRKKMENLEKELKEKSKNSGREIFISEHLLDVLKDNEWAKIRNNVILRSRYESEFDAVWEKQLEKNEDFKKLVNDQELLRKILNFIFPGKKETQEKYRNIGLEKGLKYLIKNQIIFYQRELKDQSELISNCRFEPSEKVVSKSHPIFQEYKIWEKINNLVINTKTENGFNRKGEIKYTYIDRPIPFQLKEKLYDDLQDKKEISFGTILNELKKNYGLREGVDFLNGLDTKVKLKGNETKILLQKSLGELWNNLGLNDVERQIELWEILYNGKGNEYDLDSDRTSKILRLLKKHGSEIENIEEKAIQISKIKFSRNYGSLSLKAIEKIIPLVRSGKYFNNEFSETLHQKITKLLNEEVEDPFEKSAQQFLDKNQEVLTNGGVVNAFATILVYDKHTAKDYSAEELVKNYTEISFLKQGSLRNPLAEQIINEALAIVREIWREYNIKPDEIRIELARELKNSAIERAKMHSENQKNQKNNNQIRAKLQELKQELSIANIEKYKLWLSQENLQQEFVKNYSDPSKSEIEKLKLWENQGHISPYTGQPIPLSELFNKERYDIDHIIPRSRYFDDSFGNKIICEKLVNNDKGNRTAMEYFEAGSLTQPIFSKENFIDHANNYFTGRKRKNLLATKIPEDPIQRQIKDTQYIAVKVKEELNKIVGNENVKSTSGGVTDYLRNHWGLTDKFKNILKERYETILPKLAEIDYESYMKDFKVRKEEYEKEDVPFNEIELSKENYIENFKKEYIKKKNNKLIIKDWSKRIDHRHHAIDALIIACTQPAHIKRLNDLNSVLQDWLEKNKEILPENFRSFKKTELLDEVLNLDESKRREIFRQLEKFTNIEMPWNGFVEDAENAIKEIIVSHKPKDKLTFKYDKKGNRQIKMRGQLHEGTLYGKTNGTESYRIPLIKLAGKSFATEKTIEKIVNPFLKSLIEKHLKEDYKGKKEDAFSAEGILDLNNKLAERKDENGNPKPHPPISTIKIYYKNPEKNKKKSSDEEENISLQKLHRQKSFNDSLYVKTGDNYLFAVLEKEVFNKKTRQIEKKRDYDLITFFDATNLLKEEFNKSENKNEFDKDILFKNYFEEKNKAKLLFTLKQNDVVYLPNEDEEIIFDEASPLYKEYWSDLKERNKNIYIVQKFSGKEIYFIKHTIADMVRKKIEYGSQDCYQSLNGKSIKDFCFKLETNRLGKITKVIK